MRYAVLLSILLCAPALDRAFGCGNYLEFSALDAVSEDAATAELAIEELRAAGPRGLEALLAAHEDILAFAGGGEFDAARWARLQHALDSVGGQRDCRTSRLFWHTDLETAKAAAQAGGKPILSLRLLGKLTDEYSCANSRFFRTTLYANAEVATYLKDHFVLHWKSVRPVPRVTIDFGDGRKLERTLTGNSIHYVLDAQGQTIDALPGLYGPKVFTQRLNDAEQILATLNGAAEEERPGLLAKYHQTRIEAIAAAWQSDLEKIGVSVPTPEVTTTAAAPTAGEAGLVAFTKGRVETPILWAITPETINALTTATTDDVWTRLAELHFADAELDAASIALMRAEHPAAAVAGARAMSKRVVEDPLVRMVRNFQNSVALDTVRNEYVLHRQIHEWLAADGAPEVDVLNDRVYAELFLTPSSDPWLGLMPSDTYTALRDGGVTE